MTAGKRGGPSLPFAPLEPWMPKVNESSAVTSQLRDAVKKSRQRGVITAVTADRIAVALGTHPGLIWVADWWLPMGDDVDWRPSCGTEEGYQWHRHRRYPQWPLPEGDPCGCRAAHADANRDKWRAAACA